MFVSIKRLLAAETSGGNLIGCQKDAQEKRSGPIVAYECGAYSASTKSITIADAVAAWLDSKRGVVRPNTYASYELQTRYVVDPLFPATERKAIVRSGAQRQAIAPARRR